MAWVNFFDGRNTVAFGGLGIVSVETRYEKGASFRQPAILKVRTVT
jgi:hypothetical protein